MAVEYTTTRDSIKSVNTLVYGPSGVGKTKLIKTLPKPVIISSEKKNIVIAKYDIPVMLIKTLEDLQQAIKDIQANTHGFTECCLDSATDIAKTCLSEKKRNAKDARKAFYDTQDEIMDCIRKLRDLKIHTYVIAQHSLMMDAAGLRINMPSMPSKAMTEELPFMFDVVMAMQVDKADKRWLQTSLSSTWYAKDSSEALNPVEKPDLGKIFQKIANSLERNNGKKGQKGKKGKKAKK
jgi:GTPase SAR1 family protein